jgi:hypothetical protein
MASMRRVPRRRAATRTPEALLPSPRKRKPNPYTLPAALAAEAIVNLDDAEDIAGMSRETIERTMPDKIIQLSKRLKGVKLKHILRLGSGDAT